MSIEASSFKIERCYVNLLLYFDGFLSTYCTYCLYDVKEDVKKVCLLPHGSVTNGEGQKIFGGAVTDVQFESWKFVNESNIFKKSFPISSQPLRLVNTHKRIGRMT